MNLDIQNEIDIIKKSPSAVLIFKSLQNYLEKEKKKRLHFYETVREDQKAEFINGNIIIHSSVMLRHSNVSFYLANLIHNYLSYKTIGVVHHEKLMIRLTRNDYEPDICFFNKEKADNFKADQLLFPAPDFIVEVISKSTEKTDRTIKFTDYQNHGVKEYWIIDPEKEFVEQYFLKNDEYELIQKTSSGQITSFVIDGFSTQQQYQLCK
ncbi:MAG: hypothetical protein B6I20_13830 [Bacteroidetes bacterium 4572_117]|nr:MAG: hypothetical protein B6I20_13830 [Bacteroidetes bacterium 4572_117]